ncbi:glycosyltransferase 61 family protein [Methylobacterium oryzae]|uniref:F5/8 type C domain-containing protein n=1 Tax=Methylobacterium oryzae TaxID=334852 RepID=A0ABU7TUD2_9HYPH
MSIFSRCVRTFGQVNFDHCALRINDYKNAFSDGFNLYDSSGMVIFDGCYLRGVPNIGALVDKYHVNASSTRFKHVLRGKNYFWLGPMHQHFGHFLIGAISRLWPIYRHNVKDFIFVYSHGPEPRALFETDYTRSILGGIGISEDQIIKITDFVAVQNLRVVQPSMVENHSINKLFLQTIDRICVGLGVHRGDIRPSSRAVYVTKQLVTAGVRGILNEQFLAEKLRARGIEVRSPEQLSFAEQITFWNSYKGYMGFAGSSFHMSGFSKRSSFCTISHDRTASGNQVLLDYMGSKSHLYLHASQHISRFGPTSNFSEVMLLDNPDAFVDAVAECIALLESENTNLGQKISYEPKSLLVSAVPDEPFGENICRGAVESQSSQGHISTTNVDAPRSVGALSGALTGQYQISTGEEPFAWWQVDFSEACWIYEVRIFTGRNVMIEASGFRSFSIQTSLDGLNWTNIFVSDGAAEPVCATGELFRWSPNEDTFGRYIRIQALHEKGLLLDQVEVFGEPCVTRRL